MNTTETLAVGRARRLLRAEPALARLVRQRSGLTQAEMASILGVDASAVCRWESGKRTPRCGVLKRYTELLEQLQEN